MARRAIGKQNKDLTYKDVEEALYKRIDLQLNLWHLSDILSVVGLYIGAAAILDRARHRIQLCATDKLHGTLIEIVGIAAALCCSCHAVAMVNINMVANRGSSSLHTIHRNDQSFILLLIFPREIELIIQPAGVLDKTRNVRLETMSSPTGIKSRACDLRAQIYRSNLIAPPR